MTRRIGLILGDQLDHGSTLLKEIDKASDRFMMLEVRQESTHPPSHKMRTALFLSAMRHHALWLIQRGWDVSYCTLDEPHAESFETALLQARGAWSTGSLQRALLSSGSATARGSSSPQSAR